VLIKVKVHPCLDLNFAGSRQKKTGSVLLGLTKQPSFCPIRGDISI
jgi:hypothetical protein